MLLPGFGRRGDRVVVQMRDYQQDLAVGVGDDRGHQARRIETRKKTVGRVALVIHKRALEQDRSRCHPARRALCDNIVIRGATFAIALPICAAVTAPLPPLGTTNSEERRGGKASVSKIKTGWWRVT